MELFLITGVNGAGKTTLIYTLEELGYFIIENLPVSLKENLYLEMKKNPNKYERLALTVPVEEALEFNNFFKEKKDVRTIFLGLNCSESSLIERFKLTRRFHPRQAHGASLGQAIAIDHKHFDELCVKLDILIDTSKLQSSELRRYIYKIIEGDRDNTLCLSFTSFGFKKGVPMDAEIVFDTRNIPNPFWIDELKDLTGLDQPVIDYVMKQKETKELLSHIIDYLSYYAYEASKSGRNLLAIAIGCTGGHHRSVAIATYLKKYFSKEYKTIVFHKDLN